jgi:separase
VLGNLWDVTDRDLDRLTATVMRELFALATVVEDPTSVSSSHFRSTKKVLFQDEDEEKDNGDSSVPEQSQSLLSQSLAASRDVCRMRFAVAAAAIVYGIPVPINTQS